MNLNKYLAKLLVGVRVKPSDEGIKRLRGLRDKIEGTIVGISRDSHCIRVLKDGQKTASLYWPGYWENEDL